MLQRICGTNRIEGGIFFVSKFWQITTSVYICTFVSRFVHIPCPDSMRIAIRVSRPVLTFLSTILPSSTHTEYEDIMLLRNVGTALPICVMSIPEDRFVNPDRSGSLKCHSTLLTWRPCYSSQHVSSGKKHWLETFFKDCVLRLPATWNWYSYNIVIT
jgi:hypothetical protein